MANAVEWVYVTVLIPLLIGKKWRSKGDQVAVSFDRAKRMASGKPPAVKILGNPEFSVMPGDELDTSPKGDVDTPTDPPNTPPGSDENTPETLDDFGLPPATVKLLKAGGLDTPVKVREAIAAKSLVEIDGIGNATAASITAAFEE